MTRQVQVPAGAVEVVADHVHPSMKAHPFDSPARFARLPALWSKSYFHAAATPASAAVVQRYIGTQHARPWRKEKTR